MQPEYSLPYSQEPALDYLETDELSPHFRPYLFKLLYIDLLGAIGLMLCGSVYVRMYTQQV
jgi:hypothetical protein